MNDADVVRSAFWELAEHAHLVPVLALFEVVFLFFETDLCLGDGQETPIGLVGFDFFARSCHLLL